MEAAWLFDLDLLAHSERRQKRDLYLYEDEVSATLSDNNTPKRMGRVV